MMDFGNDGMQPTRNDNLSASSSGGSGGIFGNASASASIGDVGLGNSEASTGDVRQTNRRNSFRAAPVFNNANNMQLVIVAVAALAGLYVAKKTGVF